MMSELKQILSPDDPSLERLCKALAELANHRRPNQWPTESLELCAKTGVFSWFIGHEFGGQAWNAEQIARAYLQLGAACLTTTFIITQRTAATRRLESSQNEALKAELLPLFSRGENSTTVGISHLTTSRQHTRPALLAQEVEGGFQVNGYCPWVTGGKQADHVLMGATLADERQILFMVDSTKVQAKPPHELLALTGSCTGAVELENVFVPQSRLVGGPVEQVIQSGKSTMPGGSQTSALAIALASAACGFLSGEAEKRPELQATSREFSSQVSSLQNKLLEMARGTAVCSAQELRSDANSLVLRATQAAMVAAKGAGYVSGHRVGRWCQEALFFLVWSCPQPVLAANLCELAGVEI